MQREKREMIMGLFWWHIYKSWWVLGKNTHTQAWWLSLLPTPSFLASVSKVCSPKTHPDWKEKHWCSSKASSLWDRKTCVLCFFHCMKLSDALLQCCSCCCWRNIRKVHLCANIQLWLTMFTQTAHKNEWPHQKTLMNY